MKVAAILRASVLSIALGSTAFANTYGSVEPVANTAVIDTNPLRGKSLAVREAFAARLLQCGIVDDVIAALSATKSITTINRLNTHFEVGAGGFFGETNPSFVYTVIDSGPNAASVGDVARVTDGLGYVLSQGSAFLLDADNPDSFDFSANYVVLNFATPPPLRRSAALFETVGEIDEELFATDSSGYTQFGRAYLSLQSFVPDDQFIAGYVEAAAVFGVEYTPVVGGVPSLLQGGAAFPGNDWVASPRGEQYLSRLPAPSHRPLRSLRLGHLRFTRDALRVIEQDGTGPPHDRPSLRRKMSELRCP